MSSTTEVVPFAPDHLDQLAELFNVHLDAVVPGLALPGTYPVACTADRGTRAHASHVRLRPAVRGRAGR
jgi:hypothetical protein